ncbi:MAG: SDR family NAD(P)-dependent oxidoreductase [Candidatus Eremiobacteraeota bacterium]|nr:SDR family NAD(P)-dependent oxidoreductase [Candidatus Eremiobacteraeota bacterium]
MSDLAGKHALVTGGRGGIGLAIATALARDGARVSVVSRSVREHEFFCASADVTREDDVARAFDECRVRNGPIEILVNSSGIADSAPLIRTGLAMWDQILATNLTGTFLCTRNAVEDMIVAKWGRILNVASTAGLAGAAYISAYCASKHGVVGFTRAIAAEFASTGITANAICPGYTETDMMREAIAKITKFTGVSEEAARERLAQSNPEGRIATAEEVAAAALGLMTDSRNGVALVVPGNIVA